MEVLRGSSPSLAGPERPPPPSRQRTTPEPAWGAYPSVSPSPHAAASPGANGPADGGGRRDFAGSEPPANGYSPPPDQWAAAAGGGGSQGYAAPSRTSWDSAGSESWYAEFLGQELVPRGTPRTVDEVRVIAFFFFFCFSDCFSDCFCQSLKHLRTVLFSEESCCVAVCGCLA